MRLMKNNNKKECPKKYSSFQDCLRKEAPFKSYSGKEQYCSDETCPYSHHKPRRKLKKEDSDAIKPYKTIVYFEISCGPNTEVEYEGFVSEEQIQKDYEDWLDRYIYSTPSYVQRGEIVD